MESPTWGESKTRKNPWKMKKLISKRSELVPYFRLWRRRKNSGSKDISHYHEPMEHVQVQLGKNKKLAAPGNKCHYLKTIVCLGYGGGVSLVHIIGNVLG